MTPATPRNAGKGWTSEEVAQIFAAMDITNITSAQLARLSAINGTRTVSSFEHQFRPVFRQVKEIKAGIENGEISLEPVQAGTKRGMYSICLCFVM